MAKFRRGDWVRHSRKGVCGCVTGHRGRSTLVRWIGCNKASSHGTRSLRPSDPPRALVLEGNLDPELHSERSEEHLLRTWFDSQGILLAYKNVHSLEDLPILAKRIRANRPPFIHISCHGGHDDSGRPYIFFAPSSARRERIYLDDNRTVEVFRDAFEGMPVLFSACLLGKYRQQIERLRHEAGLGPVAAFTREVRDSETMLFELLLYQGVLANGWTFRTAVGNVCEALKCLRVRGGRGKAQRMARVF